MKEIELIEKLEDRLNEHCERLEKHLQVRIYRLLNKIEDEMYEENLLKKSQRKEKLDELIEIYEEFYKDGMSMFPSSKETQKIVEEHAAAERAIQNNGWVDFDPENTDDLIDDENYLIRQQDSEGRWCTPHMAFWCKEEQQFCLLHTLMGMSPKVDQYFRIPK